MEKEFPTSFRPPLSRYSTNIDFLINSEKEEESHEQETGKKYEFTGETMEWTDPEGEIHILHRIRALKKIFNTKAECCCIVKVGELVGWIESEDNLSQDGLCWLDSSFGYYTTIVCGNARVSGNAVILYDAQVYGNAVVSMNAAVSDDAKVYGNAEVTGGHVKNHAEVFGNAKVSGGKVGGHAKMSGGEVVDCGNVRGDAVMLSSTVDYEIYKGTIT